MKALPLNWSMILLVSIFTILSEIGIVLAKSEDMAVLPPSPLTNKTIMFVSGWPQSGTSLVQQLFTITPGISTMVEKCNKAHGTKCHNWNHEGQWLLERVPEVSSYLSPGKMCPIEEYDKLHPPVTTKRAIIDTWSKYWDLNGSLLKSTKEEQDQQILIEKSPQSMLKIPFLENVFSNEGLKNLKFLIILKHPLTLNIATLPDFGWLTNTVISKSKNENNLKTAPTSGATSASGNIDAKYNSDIEISENIRHFLYFMTHSEVQEHYYNKNSPTSTISECSSMGWVPALDKLRDQLEIITNNNNDEDQSSYNIDEGNEKSRRIKPHVSVGIIRYEYFQKPYVLCKAIYAFGFDLSYDEVEMMNMAYIGANIDGDIEVEKQGFGQYKSKWKNYLSYRKVVNTICDHYFHPTKSQSASATTQSSNTGSAIDNNLGGEKNKKNIYKFRRPPKATKHRKLSGWGFWSDSESVHDASTESEENVADVFHLEDPAGATDNNDDDDVGIASKGHGIHSRGSFSSSDSLSKKKKEILSQKLGTVHRHRVKKNTIQSDKLSTSRRRRKKLSQYKKANRNVGSSKRVGPLKNRRQLRLREQKSSSAQSFNFKPQIVKKSLELRLQEFDKVMLTKKKYLQTSEYIPNSLQFSGKQTTSDIRIGKAREHIRSNSTFGSHLKVGATLLDGLNELEKRLRPYGYSINQGSGYNVFYKQETVLDQWDLVKQWKPKNVVY